LPCEIEGIDGNAVTAESGARIEGHETEGLRSRGLDDLPDVDAHGAIDDLQFVDEGDVDAAEDVLEQLRRLGGAARGDRDDCLDGATVEGLRLFKTGGSESAHDLGDLGDL